jgi:NDP-sugar pyrophosphorylase family protein
VKAVILAGGEGTRLRPLTLKTPKPIVPLFDRPFLRCQLDLLATAGVSNIVFSVAFEPDRVRAVFGNGRALGCHIEYAVESTPLGTGGAVRNALPHLDDTTIVFNGDVLTDVDLPAIVAKHRESGAEATLVLTPVPNPSSYGLVETEPDGRVLRFIEKPGPEEITTNTINAGIYVLNTPSLELIPTDRPYSIERGFFPALLRRKRHVQAVVHRGYWIDIGTPQKYLQVHRDVLRRRFAVDLPGDDGGGVFVHPAANVESGAALEPPCYVGPGCHVASGARVGPDTVLVGGVHLANGAEVLDSVVWERTRVGAHSWVSGCLLAGGVRLGRHVRLSPGAVLGDEAYIPDHSRLA